MNPILHKNISKPHPIYAGFCDLYLLLMVGSALIAIVSRFTETNYYTPLIAIVLFVVILIFIFSYHFYINKKVTFLTFGEVDAGKKIVSKKRQWSNPYSINRWGIFLTSILALLIIGNMWDTLEVNIITYPMIIGKVLRIAIIFLGLFYLGKGKILWAIFLSIIFLLPALMFLSAIDYNNLYILSAFVNGIIALSFLLIFIFYRKKIKS